MKKGINEIMAELKEPFNEDELEFKVGATNEDKSMGLALAYVEARAIQNRLDRVLGVTNWKVQYREITGGFICNLAIRVNDEWTDKEDGAQVTDYESIKGGISSAFKRVAASGYGVGRYLYDVRNQWFSIKQRGKSYIFTDRPTLDFGNKGTVSKAGSPPDNKEDKLQRAKRMQINFGKYNGRTLEDIYKDDIGYFKYLLNNGRDEKLVSACRYINDRQSC